MLEYHRKFYHPENLFLIITGDINPEDVFHALQPVEEKIMGKVFCPTFSAICHFQMPYTLYSFLVQ